jgi:hypothetical protein
MENTMKTQAIYSVKLPDYSLPYLINGDSSGLEEEDKTAIDQYMNYYYDIAESYHGSVVINPLDMEAYFTWKPAFGLACNVVDTDIIILSN